MVFIFLTWSHFGQRTTDIFIAADFLICICYNNLFTDIEHAFTVFDDDRYNELADSRSWHEMATFLGNAFGLVSYDYSAPNGTTVETVEYSDGDFSLTGYLAIPEGAEMGSTPAIIVVPDWDGVSGPDGYEAQRATLLAQEGYVAFAADIYGSDLQQVESFDVRIEQATFYRTNYTLFVSRIQAAVDLVAAHELVNPDEVMMLGYCFGGTGVVDYAFSGLNNVKAVVPFHGGLTSLAPIEDDNIYPYVLIQSGGIDDAHGNNTELEISLNGANATWEITRYSGKSLVGRYVHNSEILGTKLTSWTSIGVDHGFTVWDAAAYSAVADWRSWDAMLTLFEMILGGDVALTGVDDGESTTGEDTAVNGDGDTSMNGDGDTSMNGDGDTSTDGDGDTSVNGDGDTAVNGSGDAAGEGDATSAAASRFLQMATAFIGISAAVLF